MDAAAPAVPVHQMKAVVSLVSALASPLVSPVALVRNVVQTAVAAHVPRAGMAIYVSMTVTVRLHVIQLQTALARPVVRMAAAASAANAVAGSTVLRRRCAWLLRASHLANGRSAATTDAAAVVGTVRQARTAPRPVYAKLRHAYRVAPTGDAAMTVAGGTAVPAVPVSSAMDLIASYHADRNEYAQISLGRSRHRRGDPTSNERSNDTER